MTMNRLFFAAVLGALAGCEQPELIDRTQPNYIKKSDLDGVWYLKETVVDAPKTPSGTVIGYGGKLEKIRWEIQEDLLVAMRSYEIVPGADPRVDRANSSLGDVKFQDGKPYKGNVVFAYRITSHFDRQRQYNAATGEESNVLEENATDRPWYQREYIRVDFQRNIALNADSNCTNGVLPQVNSFGCQGDSNGLLFARFVTDQDQQPADQAQVFERDASGRLTYFDWTTQTIVDPAQYNYPGYGWIPYCWLDSTYDCMSIDVRTRTSVLRVDDTARDYEPLVYSDKLMVKFGYFRKEAYSYNIDFGYTYSGLQLFAMRHNIWQRAHNDDGSVIPVTQRALRPIVYYMSENTPAELRAVVSPRLATAQGYDPKETIEASWDHSYRRAVAVPRGLEVSDVPQMFYICESPVPEGAPAACGKPGTYARPGDIRYHLVNYVHQNAGGLLGLGPSAMDPETGRVVSAAANTYGPVLDAWAGGSQQVIDVVNGELSPSQLVLGEDIRDFVQANFSPTDPRRPNSGPWTSQQGLVSDATRPLGSMEPLAVGGALKARLQEFEMNGLPQFDGSRRKHLEQILKRSPALEGEFYNLPDVRLAVQSRSTHVAFQERVKTDETLYRAMARNLLFGKDPVEQLREQRRNMVSPEIGCFYEHSYSDEDYEGLAKRKLAYQQAREAHWLGEGREAAVAKQLAKADVYTSLRREAYRSVQEHEIGHTLGLRHNFVGSVDAMNFKPGYWDLRKETVGVMVGGDRVLPVTPQNLLDASKPNQKQKDEGMYELTYSTIMDYGARPNSATHGVGKYDDAAILFAYSGGGEPGWVEVFNELRSDYGRTGIVVPLDNQSRVFTARGAHVEIPLAHVTHYNLTSRFFSDKYHYSTLPFLFADQKPTFEEMLDQGIARMNNRSFRKWSEMQPWYERIDAELKNFNLSWSRYNAEVGYDDNYDLARIIVGLAGGRDVPVEVPYMYCSDAEVGANLMCNRHDQGADPFEMTSKWIERFEQAYIFENFRRDRYGYGIWNVLSRKFGRYLGNIPNVYQHWLINIHYAARYLQYTPEQMDSLRGAGDPIYQNYWTMAVTDSINLLLQQFTVPQAGYYGKKVDGTWEYTPSGDLQNRRLCTNDETPPACSAELAFKNAQTAKGYTDIAYVPRGPGRSMFTVYDQFGYNGYSRIDEAGHFWDVYSAMLALTTSESNFLGVDRQSDSRAYYLPWYMTFYEELGPFFNAYWTEDKPYYSPQLAKQSDGTAFVQLPTFVRGEDYVPGFIYPPAPVTPVDGSGTPMTLTRATPVQTWTSRYYSQFLAMASFTDNFNMEYAERNRVFRLGAGDNLDPAPGFKVEEFHDPFGGGYIYAAVREDPAVALTQPVPAAAVMVMRAAQEKIDWENAKLTGTDEEIATTEAALRQSVRTLEIMRGMYSIFGAAF